MQHAYTEFAWCVKWIERARVTPSAEQHSDTIQVCAAMSLCMHSQPCAISTNQDKYCWCTLYSGAVCLFGWLVGFGYAQKNKAHLSAITKYLFSIFLWISFAAATTTSMPTTTAMEYIIKCAWAHTLSLACITHSQAASQSADLVCSVCDPIVSQVDQLIQIARA